jgi:hypothetical protein
VFAVLACIGLARAAEKAPEYQKLRYEEDYRYLRSPDARGDFFDPIKYLPITSDGAAYLSLGGMLRERYEYQSNPLDGPQDRAGVFLQRYLLHADLHLGAHARAFAQLQSALANGRRGGPSPVDEDELDLHQAFVDVALGIGETLALTLRTGRQEMAYGAAHRRTAGSERASQLRRRAGALARRRLASGRLRRPARAERGRRIRQSTRPRPGALGRLRVG